MATIDSASIIRKILQNDGIFPGDPQLHAVISYINDWGNPTFAICQSAHVLHETTISPFVHSPQILWSIQAGLSAAGSAFLLSFEEESE
jgi:hypothetical protein